MKKETTTQKLSKEQKREIEKVKGIIKSEIDWDKTSSGYDYWEEVYGKLRDLANQKNICDKCGRVLE